MPAVSIILPAFNRIALLRETVRSVFEQTFSDWELIVADDGSSQDTRSYLRGIDEPRVRVLWLPHSGKPSRVRNAAIAIARAPYLAFLDSDDIWSKDKLRRQMDLHRRRPESRWSYTGCADIDRDGRPCSPEALVRHVWPEGWILEDVLTVPRNQMPMASIVAERDLVDEVGGFDEDQVRCEDLDLILRMAMRSPAALIGEPLCFIRSKQAEGDHHSGDRAAECIDRVKLFRKMAGLIGERRLRAICLRRRAEQALAAARFQAEKGQYQAVWRTLGAACTFSWSYPEWWFGAVKIALKPAVPGAALQAYRGWARERRGPAGP